MNILYYCHFTIPIFIILMPLLPVYILKYTLPIPALLYVVWFIFNGCPISKISQKNMKNTDNFILPLFQKYINPNMTLIQSDSLVKIIISISMLVSAYKIIYTCEKENKN